MKAFPRLVCHGSARVAGGLRIIFSRLEMANSKIKAMIKNVQKSYVGLWSLGERKSQRQQILLQPPTPFTTKPII
jgi:hypothetical protein